MNFTISPAPGEMATLADAWLTPGFPLMATLTMRLQHEGHTAVSDMAQRAPDAAENGWHKASTKAIEGRSECENPQNVIHRLKQRARSR